MGAGVAFAHTRVARHRDGWAFALCHWAASPAFVYGERAEPFRGATVIGDAGDLPADRPLVVLAPRNGMTVRGDESLATFVHPADAIYLFGSDSHHIDSSAFGAREPDHLVYIPTDSKDQMHSFAAWSVVAWDRRMKGA